MLREVPIYLGGCTEGLVIINNAEGSADLPWWMHGGFGNYK